MSALLSGDARQQPARPMPSLPTDTKLPRRAMGDRASEFLVTVVVGTIAVLASTNAIMHLPLWLAELW